MTNATVLDLDAMLDGTLDNITEAPDYVTPPAGQYVLVVEDAKIETYKNKEQVESTRVKITYKVGSTISTEEAPVADGSLFTETFQATEEGLGYFKKQARAILNVSDLAGVSMRDVLASLKGVEFKTTITIRKSVSKGTTYENVNVRPVHEETA